MAGPFPNSVCEGMTFLDRFYFSCLIGQIFIWQLVKYCFVFHFERIILLDEKLAAFFLTLSNVVLNAVFAVSVNFAGFHVSEMEYHICTGNHPHDNIVKLPVKFELDRPENSLKIVVRKDPLNYSVNAMFILVSVI